MANTISPGDVIDLKLVSVGAELMTWDGLFCLFTRWHWNEQANGPVFAMDILRNLYKPILVAHCFFNFLTLILI